MRYYLFCFIAMFIVIISLFLVPSTLFTSEEAYYMSISVRCIVAIVLLFLGFYGTFAGHKARYILFVCTTLAVGIIGVTLYSVLESQLGSLAYVVCILSIPVLFLLSLFLDKKSKQKRLTTMDTAVRTAIKRDLGIEVR